MLRGFCGYCFIFINDPQSYFSKIMNCLLIIFTVVEAISVEVLFMRGMPSAIRGTMMGMVAFFGQIGMLVFTLVGG